MYYSSELRGKFDKKAFQKEVTHNVKTLFRKEVEEATQEQLFQAVSYAVKEVIIDDWLATQKTYKNEEPKTVYYMSMEFLMGRALGNNLINLCAYKEVKEALDEMGIDLNIIEDQEPDAAAWKWRTWTSCSMFPRLLDNSWLSGIWMRNPLPLWYV